jgi:hypothetical protein
MRKVDFLEGLPALNTEIFNRLVKYLTEDLKLRFNDIFEPGILKGYPSNGNEFLISDVSIDQSNKNISFTINSGIAYVTNNTSIIPDPNDNSFVGDGFFERIYISNFISRSYSFSDKCTLYIYANWKQEKFEGDNNQFTSLIDESTLLRPFLYDSYNITIVTNVLSDPKYILLGKINIYYDDDDNVWKSQVDYAGRKYFKLRIKEEDFKSYLSYIFKNGVITTRDKSQQNIDVKIIVNKLNIKINDGFFITDKDLFYINGYIISNFNGLNSYVDAINGGYTITINDFSSYYLYIQQINNYETITFSLKPLNEVVNDGIKLLKISYSNTSGFNIDEIYDIFNIIDPVKTIGINSIPLKLIKYDVLDSDDKNVVEKIFGKITSDLGNPSKFIKTHHIDDNAITESKIYDGSISTDKIKNGAVTDDKITPLYQRKTISYSFPRYLTQNITGNIQTGPLTKFYIGQKMRLSAIRFMFESMPINSYITFSFQINGNDSLIFMENSNQVNKITIQNHSDTNSISYVYVVVDYDRVDKINNLNIKVYVDKLNIGLYNNSTDNYGILFDNEILSVLVDDIQGTWTNSFLSIELELEEYSGSKNDLSSIILYKNWRY